MPLKDVDVELSLDTQDAPDENDQWCVCSFRTALFFLLAAVLLIGFGTLVGDQMVVGFTFQFIKGTRNTGFFQISTYDISYGLMFKDTIVNKTTGNFSPKTPQLF